MIFIPGLSLIIHLLIIIASFGTTVVYVILKKLKKVNKNG